MPLFNHGRARVMTYLLGMVPYSGASEAPLVGLLKLQPDVAWTGTPGAYGESTNPAYSRQRVPFINNDTVSAENARVVTFTGLTAGTYNYVALFGNPLPPS